MQKTRILKIKYGFPESKSGFPEAKSEFPEAKSGFPDYYHLYFHMFDIYY